MKSIRLHNWLNNTNSKLYKTGITEKFIYVHRIGLFGGYDIYFRVNIQTKTLQEYNQNDNVRTDIQLDSNEFEQIKLLCC